MPDVTVHSQALPLVSLEPSSAADWDSVEPTALLLELVSSEPLYKRPDQGHSVHGAIISYFASPKSPSGFTFKAS